MYHLEAMDVATDVESVMDDGALMRRCGDRAQGAAKNPLTKRAGAHGPTRFLGAHSGLQPLLVRSDGTWIWRL